MILQVINKYPQVDYDTAKLIMTSHNWNINEVESLLTNQFSERMKEEEKRENATL